MTVERDSFVVLLLLLLELATLVSTVEPVARWMSATSTRFSHEQPGVAVGDLAVRAARAVLAAVDDHRRDQQYPEPDRDHDHPEQHRAEAASHGRRELRGLVRIRIRVRRARHRIAPMGDSLARW
jgi:hypothetical protein